MKKISMAIVIFLLWANAAYSYETLTGGSQSIFDKFEGLFQLFFIIAISASLAVFSTSMLASIYSTVLRYRHLTKEKERIENEINNSATNCITFSDPHDGICQDAKKIEGDIKNTESSLDILMSRLKNNGGDRNGKR